MLQPVHYLLRIILLHLFVLEIDGGAVKVNVASRVTHERHAVLLPGLVLLTDFLGNIERVPESTATATSYPNAKAKLARSFVLLFRGIELLSNNLANLLSRSFSQCNHVLITLSYLSELQFPCTTYPTFTGNTWLDSSSGSINSASVTPSRKRSRRS